MLTYSEGRHASRDSLRLWKDTETKFALGAIDYSILILQPAPKRTIFFRSRASGWRFWVEGVECWQPLSLELQVLPCLQTLQR